MHTPIYNEKSAHGVNHARFCCSGEPYLLLRRIFRLKRKKCLRKEISGTLITRITVFAQAYLLAGNTGYCMLSIPAFREKGKDYLGKSSFFHSGDP